MRRSPFRRSARQRGLFFGGIAKGWLEQKWLRTDEDDDDDDDAYGDGGELRATAIVACCR